MTFEGPIPSDLRPADLPRERAEFVSPLMAALMTMMQMEPNALEHFGWKGRAPESVAASYVADEQNAARRAELWWVSPEIGELLAAISTDLEPVIEREDLPGPAGLVWFAGGLYSYEVADADWRRRYPNLSELMRDVEAGTVSACGFLWWTFQKPDSGETALSVAVLTDSTDTHRRMRARGIAPATGVITHDNELLVRFGVPLGSDMTREEDWASEYLKILRALWLFVQQRLLERHPAEPLSRGERRRLASADLPTDPVTIIRLRARESSRSGDEGMSVDWSHRWLVRGHWRRQWYPSIDLHRPVWVMPYVKGPEDKPLVVKEHVLAVVR